jgi:hypothetical protein
MVFLFAGAAGSNYGLPLGALLLLGFAIRKFLDTYGSLEPQEDRFLRLEDRRPSR